MTIEALKQCDALFVSRWIVTKKVQRKWAPCMLQCCELSSVCQLPVHFTGRLVKGSTVYVMVLRVVQCLSTSCTFYSKISKSEHHLHYSVVSCPVFVNFLFILQGGEWKGAPCVLQCCELSSISVNCMYISKNVNACIESSSLLAIVKLSLSFKKNRNIFWYINNCMCVALLFISWDRLRRRIVMMMMTVSSIVQYLTNKGEYSVHY